MASGKPGAVQCCRILSFPTGGNVTKRPSVRRCKSRLIQTACALRRIRSFTHWLKPAARRLSARATVVSCPWFRWTTHRARLPAGSVHPKAQVVGRSHIAPPRTSSDRPFQIRKRPILQWQTFTPPYDAKTAPLHWPTLPPPSTDVLARIADTSQTNLADLLPWKWSQNSLHKAAA